MSQHKAIVEDGSATAILALAIDREVVKQKTPSRCTVDADYSAASFVVRLRISAHNQPVETARFYFAHAVCAQPGSQI